MREELYYIEIISLKIKVVLLNFLLLFSSFLFLEPVLLLSTQQKQEQDFKKPETAETRKRVDSGNYQTPGI